MFRGMASIQNPSEFFIRANKAQDIKGFLLFINALDLKNKFKHTEDLSQNGMKYYCVYTGKWFVFSEIEAIFEHVKFVLNTQKIAYDCDDLIYVTNLPIRPVDLERTFLVFDVPREKNDNFIFKYTFDKNIVIPKIEYQKVIFRLMCNIVFDSYTNYIDVVILKYFKRKDGKTLDKKFIWYWRGNLP